MKETDIQNSICDYLSYKRHLFWRSNNVPIFDKKSGTVRRMPKYSMNGIPDIILIKDGYFIGLEIKNEKGKQSDGQKEFQRRCKEAGGEYHVIRSIDDLKEIGL